MEALEALEAVLRAAPRRDGATLLSDQALEPLGWTAAEAREVLRGLGFAPADVPRPESPPPGAPAATPPPRPAAKPPAHSPFAALAALKPAAEPRRRPRRRRKARA